MSNTEVMVYRDKFARDAVFDDLRRTGNRSEQEVVKFSDVEPILNGLPHGELELDSKGRVRYRSIFCLAYPRREDERKTRRREMRDRNRDNPFVKLGVS